jgi:hypothetical protein
VSVNEKIAGCLAPPKLAEPAVSGMYTTCEARLGCLVRPELAERPTSAGGSFGKLGTNQQ